MLQGHQVTVEITSGQTYRGKLIEGALEGERQCDAERSKANATYS
jgi:hypothetical protein